MRLGIVTPVVNLNPRFDPPEWEQRGGIDDIVAVARAAERLGYAWVSCPEHVGIPTPTATSRGGRYWDPLATLSFVAASTQTIGLLTHVLVLGYHHPLEVVKRYGTLDVASGGRVILGVGVGSLEPEFELLDVPFAGRGARGDDALRAIRASFSQRVPSYSGTHYEFSGFVVEPSGIQRHVPVWVGGRTRRSLRRAVELGDGWIPFGLSLDDLGSILADHDKEAAGDHGRRSFDVVLAPEPPLDPLGHPEATAATVRGYRGDRRHRPVAAISPRLALALRRTARSHGRGGGGGAESVSDGASENGPVDDHGRGRYAHVLPIARPDRERPAMSERHETSASAPPVTELLELGAATIGESGGLPMRARIRAVWSGARLAAPAFPVRCTPGDNLAIHVAVASAPPGSALAVDVGAEDELGYWGEVLTTAAQSRGVAGLVIDGGVRDVGALEAHGFPVFSTMVALRGASKNRPGVVGAAAVVGGVSVEAGDWLVGDADGVAVVRAAAVEDVLAAGRARAQKEEAVFAALRDGHTTLELLGLDPSPVEGA